MSLLSIFDVAGSAMSAQSVRLNVTASNLANAESVSSNTEGTYRARHPVFAADMQNAMEQFSSASGKTNIDAAASMGVRVEGIVESNAPMNMRYEPAHPQADEDGYVAYPNVNVVEEMANMMSATRSFQMNVEVMNSAKSLAERLLRLGQ
ncbi:MAG: flagellar basal body rod protein FlgC [Pseudomonadales bacterium]|nr:flagellar basal body rod protein FlgC [Pseudomonadales bacterium]